MLKISVLLLQIILIQSIKYHHHPWRRKNHNIRQIFFPRTKTQKQSSTFQWIRNKPTIENCENIFKGDFKQEFNHDYVGITYPQPARVVITSSRDKIISSPSSNENDEILSYKETNKHKYRIIKYKKTIGKGEETYNKLKHSILQWSPTTSKDWSGIQILKPNKHILQEDISTNYEPLTNIVQIWQSNRRRLVTYSKIFGKLWCFNPCCVIYDVLDQEGEDCIFTSTAYATLKGHFLCGEERLTVGMKRKSEPSYSNSLPIIEASNINQISSQDDEGDVFVEILSCSTPSKGIFGNVVFHLVKNMQLRFFRDQLETLERIANDSL